MFAQQSVSSIQHSGRLCYRNQLGKWRTEVLQLEVYNKWWHYWKYPLCESFWSYAFICFSVGTTWNSHSSWLPPSIHTFHFNIISHMWKQMFVTLGPHSIHLFCLQKQSVPALSEDIILQLRRYWKYAPRECFLLLPLMAWCPDIDFVYFDYMTSVFINKCKHLFPSLCLTDAKVSLPVYQNIEIWRGRAGVLSKFSFATLYHQWGKGVSSPSSHSEDWSSSSSALLEHSKQLAEVSDSNPKRSVNESWFQLFASAMNGIELLTGEIQRPL